MEQRLQLTADGWYTLYNATLGQHYHSMHGALAESMRVYIELGLQTVAHLPKLSLLEMGFGTGLNALLTWQMAEQTQQIVHYTAIEAYPIAAEEAQQLNYKDPQKVQQLHQSRWNEWTQLSPFFSLKKQQVLLQEVQFTTPFDLVYFDAFAPKKQPELWTEAIFKKIADAMPSGGVLTTYSCKGTVKRALVAAGFSIEKHRGPVGKLEVLRAVKK